MIHRRWTCPAAVHTVGMAHRSSATSSFIAPPTPPIPPPPPPPPPPAFGSVAFSSPSPGGLPSAALALVGDGVDRKPCLAAGVSGSSIASWPATFPPAADERNSAKLLLLDRTCSSVPAHTAGSRVARQRRRRRRQGAGGGEGGRGPSLPPSSSATASICWRVWSWWVAISTVFPRNIPFGPSSAAKSALRHPGLELNIPPQLFCMSWCPEFEFRGTDRPTSASTADSGSSSNTSSQPPAGSVAWYAARASESRSRCPPERLSP